MPHKLCVILSLLFVPVVFSACATYAKIENVPLGAGPPSADYSVRSAIASKRPDHITLVVAFSGGGTRAAALAYGVLQGLRDTTVMVDGQPVRLLDEIDVISAVSGGSFTAAYYGLHGDGIFNRFENDFLRRDLSEHLIDGLLSPSLWFSSRGRTEMAIDVYDEQIFHGATFADLKRRNGPLIIINATDLGRGVRFSFVQDYFDLLCSDLSTFPISRAVAASSAVPVIFHPVVLQNHPGCRPSSVSMFAAAADEAIHSPQLSHVVDGLQSYAGKDQRPYIHLVDGGITDNLGLLSIYEMTEAAGGAKKLLHHLGGQPKPNFIVISVNASTTPQYEMELSSQPPAMEDIVNAVTDIPLHRTNAATLELLQNSIARWTSELATENAPITPYFVTVDFNQIADPDKRHFFNQIPTNFALNTEQVDQLLMAGRGLLKMNPEFQKLLETLQRGS